jgi:protein-S-isoprenylcysteine O-methyltransferase Ste14
MGHLMLVGNHGISNIAYGSRIFMSRLFAILIVILAVITGHSFDEKGFLDISFEVSGLLMLTICSMGRLWALMYISGNKKKELITEGPYSIVRNPLYFFSFIGAIGLGLASENVLILGLMIIFYLVYYPFTVIAEEAKLEATFGEVYLRYKKITPRFIPRFSLYKSPELYTVNVPVFVKRFVDGMWFIWMFILFNFLEMLQESGYVPVLLKVP